MQLESSVVTLMIFILGLLWKVAQTHFVVNRLVKNDEINKKRLNDIEKLQLKLVEALDRTYATQEFTYTNFVSKTEYESSYNNLEKTIVDKIGHIEKTLDKISNVIEKKFDKIL